MKPHGGTMLVRQAQGPGGPPSSSLMLEALLPPTTPTPIPRQRITELPLRRAPISHALCTHLSFHHRSNPLCGPIIVPILQIK